jgi:leader peptidase (prepilin peptidase)/N-methyltransferase
MILGASIALEYLTVFIWNITPARWLCEYGQIPDSKHEAKERSIRAYTLCFRIIFFLYISQSVMQELSLGMLLLHIILLFSLVQLSISDIKFQILQDEWILVITIVALVFPGNFKAKLQGFILPVVAYILLSILQQLFQTTPLLGMGDAKLMAALGLWFGPSGLFVIICYAFLMAGIWAFVLLLRKKATKKDRLPFGPFLSGACVYFALLTFSI